MLKTISITSLFLLLATPVLSLSKTIKPRYPASVYQIIIKTENHAKENSLANSIGLELGHRYTYTEYARIKRKNDIGTAGNYDFLLLSTGGNEWDNEAYNKFIKQPCGWETTYYSNHDLTIIHEICHEQTRSRSWVRIMKITKGRKPNLYRE